MISYIEGPILKRGSGFMVILVGQIGYKIYLNTQAISGLADIEKAQLYIYDHFKEDGHSLYGFLEWSELEFFELLITVSGVGPKSALNILASAKLDDLKGAIALGDAGPLVRVSGIGRKTAERMIVELKNKVDYLASADGLNNVPGEELEALVGLGYSLAQARTALSKVDKTLTDTSERLRQALKFL